MAGKTTHTRTHAYTHTRVRARTHTHTRAHAHTHAHTHTQVMLGFTGFHYSLVLRNVTTIEHVEKKGQLKVSPDGPTLAVLALWHRTVAVPAASRRAPAAACPTQSNRRARR